MRSVSSYAKRIRPSHGQDTRDSIDHWVEQWTQQRPDLDRSALGVFGRIHRILGYFLRMADRWLGGLGLTWETFSLIVTLRRSGPPYSMRPTDLLHESLLSSGAVTNRIDRVEHLGLVDRVTDPRDRRATLVKLTPSGRALADKAIAVHFRSMAGLLKTLTADEANDLVSLLRKTLIPLEEEQTVMPKAGSMRAKKSSKNLKKK